MWDENFVGLLVVPLTNKETTWLDVLTRFFPRKRIFLDAEEFFEADAPKILLHHYEELKQHKKTGRGENKVDWRYVKRLAKIRWSLIVFDESQRLKQRTTLESKAAARLRNSAERKIILSGTPIESRPQDLWAQFRFLAPDVFGEKWKDFEDEFLEEDGIDLSKYRPGSFQWQRALRLQRILQRKRNFREDRMREFLERIQPFALRVTKEVLDLPALRIVPEPVTLYGNQRRVYEAIERDLVSYVSGSRITAPLKVTQIVKLHQICGGFVFDDDGEVQEVGRAKLRRVLSLVKNNRKPIVIFCRYLEEVWSIEAALTGLRVETLTGKTKKKERPKIQRRFQAGKIDVLICQIKTGGVGIDLYRSCVAIFYSSSYSFIDFEQALSRLHRRGQRMPVTIFLVYAAGTIDEEIYTAIRSKRKVSEAVLNYLKQQRSHEHGKEVEEVRPPAKGRTQVRRHSARERARHRGGIRPRRAA